MSKLILNGSVAAVFLHIVSYLVAYRGEIIFYVDMTCNNLDQCLSDKGYLPDGLVAFIQVHNILNDYNSQLFYLKNGLAYADFELSYLFRYYNFVVLDLSLDNSFLVIPFYNTARIDIGFSSTALDVDNGGCVEELISIEYDNTPTWITFSWAETGLYTGAISLIVNGEIIKESNIL